MQMHVVYKMVCERGLKTSLRFQMFHYKRKLQKSRNENRKDFVKLKLRIVFTGGTKLWEKPETKYFIVFLSKLVHLNQV